METFITSTGEGPLQLPWLRNRTSFQRENVCGVKSTLPRVSDKIPASIVYDAWDFGGAGAGAFALSPGKSVPAPERKQPAYR
jgi:hypothetical protein